MIDDSDHYEAATGWAVRVGVAFVFVLVGLEKVQAASAPSWIQIFDAIGFGQWFRYFTAIVECLGGLLFLIPAATTIGAAMLASAMVGAMITQAFVLHHPANSVIPAVFLAGVVAAFMKLRRPQQS
ncbi:MAG TPA: DoxX family protein [Gemmatimonadaceae bacterium]|nr:DoxX family protein [Gemmatimonadaceae bacterium]